jgi:ABC-type uncharacterized transport system ATPase subunit
VPESAYLPRSIETTLTRETAVHQDQVRARALSSADDLLTVCGFGNAVTSNLQHGAKQQTRVGVVVRDEDQRLRRDTPCFCCLP